VGVSKSTLSLWLRDVELPDDEKEAREARRKAVGAARSISARSARQRRVRLIHDSAAAEIGTLTSRELFLVGVTLYAAEGSKAKPWSPSCRVHFTNSEASLVAVYLRWLRLLGVTDEDLVCNVMIHESADALAAEAWWRAGLELDRVRFLKPTIKRAKPVTVRKNVGADYHGCLRVTVRKSTHLNRVIAGWWLGIADGVPSRPASMSATFRPGVAAAQLILAQ
jgi:hypothetical protein